jgi:ribonuclease P protein component
VSETGETKARRKTLPRSVRLSKAVDFQRAFAGRIRCSRGPITGYGVPNGLRYWRVGLSVGRAAGSAVVRNAIKRRLREAFRHVRCDLPVAESGGYDLVLAARAHTLFTAEEYRLMVREIGEGIHQAWLRLGA